MNFVFVGPRKTASTWLHDVLINHPDIALPDTVKETFYFDKNYHKGFSWYKNSFHKKNQELTKVCGEFSPSYFTSVHAIENIMNTNKEMKIIVCLRKPVERLVSDYLHHLRYGKTKLRILDALEEKNDLTESANYSKYVKLWKENFENVIVVYYEDIVEDKVTFLKKICKFIDAPYYETLEFRTNEKSNSGGSYSNFYVAKATSYLAEALRKLGLYQLINILKKVGLKKILLNGKEINIANLISNEEIKELGNLLEKENSLYENRTY